MCVYFQSQFLPIVLEGKAQMMQPLVTPLVPIPQIGPDRIKSNWTIYEAKNEEMCNSILMQPNDDLYGQAWGTSILVQLDSSSTQCATSIVYYIALQ